MISHALDDDKMIAALSIPEVVPKEMEIEVAKESKTSRRVSVFMTETEESKSSAQSVKAEARNKLISILPDTFSRKLGGEQAAQGVGRLFAVCVFCQR